MNPFWNGRRVLVTGHTGFKGSWLSVLLHMLGAKVTGLSLAPTTQPAMFELLAPWPNLASVIGDVTDPEVVARAFADSEPEVVIHMAAQSLVRASYADPVETFGTNTMGTVQLLEAVRTADSVQVVLVVTSDKVYDQDQPAQRFTEQDRLGGADPYSASKTAQELVAASYAQSFFADSATRTATARSGNVIGGGDWAADRLVPDFFRALATGREFKLRYPHATRPWQHVLDPLRGYLAFIESLVGGADIPTALNFGPESEAVSVLEVVERLAAASGASGEWTAAENDSLQEHDTLALDSSAAAKALDWRPILHIDAALDWTARWYQAHLDGQDMRRVTVDQVSAYMDLAR